MSLSTFKGRIIGTGVSRNNKYTINISPPSGLSWNEDYNIRCESVALPDQNISTTSDDIRVGPAREHAINVTYGTITPIFLCDRKLDIKKFFESWQHLIFDKDTFRVKYFNTYIGTMTVKQHDVRDSIETMNNTTAVYTAKLFDIFPKTISELALQTGDTDFHRLSVEFEYTKWQQL